MKNIYLIGMMGAGKTSTGRKLAESLRFAFVDLDAEIVRKDGRDIPKIFAESGEPFFRDLEASVLKTISRKEDRVVATGGGIVLREENVSEMQSSGTVVLLKAAPETLWQRVKLSKDRPLLNQPQPFETLKKILNSREDAYEKSANIKIRTDEKKTEQVVEEILALLKRKK